MALQSTTPNSTPLAGLLKKDRLISLTGLGVLCLLCWIYLVTAAADMTSMEDGSLSGMQSWSGVDFMMMLAMWVIMMAGMMIPSATPMILLFSKVNDQRRLQRQSCVPTSVFATGYLLVWSVFSLAATVAQWGLQEGALLSSMMASKHAYLSGGLLIGAGIYQWSSLKLACLRKCRTPLHFLMTEWREGNTGALIMGCRHGLFCLGCCWALMCLLFVLGVMNLLWIAVLTAFVLLEKVVPGETSISRISGVLLVAWGAWILFA
jgi:predicted metal-binding membrane protein